jgi:predicted PurR-regulated permease PerM
LDVALAQLTQFVLVAHADVLSHWLRDWLDPTDSERIQRRYVALARHLLTVTLAHAAVQGALLGALAWLVGGFHPVLVAVVATVLGLLPFIGHLAVWGPLAGILWSRGDGAAALALAAGGLLLAGGLWWGERHLGRRRGTDDLWLGTLTFLALTGGILALGWRGLAVGPAAVLLVATLGTAVRHIYGQEVDAAP